MKVHIVGRGKFGKFLEEILSPHVEFSEEAEHVLLAVSLQRYEEVAAQFSGRHLVNICSVQQEPTEICQKFSDHVTGFHPLFGPRSFKQGKAVFGVLTQECSKTKEILDLFQKVGVKILKEIEGSPITPEKHDEIMFLTHYLPLKAFEKFSSIIHQGDNIPLEFCPPSFFALRDFMDEFSEVSPGTRDSILANPFAKNLSN